jgi:bifunctional non-homologous end joining protein LigD
MAHRANVSSKGKLVISNPEKILYPASQFTKAQVIEYYVAVSRFLLPHFKDRPVTLKRYPDGVHGDFFYEKDAPDFTPQWVKTFPVPRREGGPDIRYILISDVATLAWAANMAAIELHPFLHRVPGIDTPTSVVFDLDPGEGADVLQCAEVSFLLRDLLQRLKLKSFAKVSGSKGIQVYVPLNRAGITYATTQPFARAVAEMLEREHADQIVADMSKTLRREKVFIDWSQNADHKTTVGVYSLRAKRPRPYVSVPVEWSELKAALRKEDRHLLDFPPDAVLERLKKVGDLFAPVVKLKQRLPEAFSGRALPRRRSRAEPDRRSSAAAVSRSLHEYEAKRRFDRTAEPAPTTPRRSRQGSRRRFVVQKHAASHLHYDFRLEMHDVLKSWAMPHGLPMTRGEVHSAFETEDHPIEYLSFEGIIAEGEYGGGTVMIWDIGTYEVIEGNYWKGRLSVFLSGTKLKGEWLLERGEDERGKTKWLVTKMDAAKKRLSAKRAEVSALSGRSLEQIAKEKDATWRSNRSEQEKKTSNAQRSTSNVQLEAEAELREIRTASAI